MDRYKKFLLKQVKLIPLIALVSIVSGSIIYEINQRTYKEVSEEEFTKIAIENKVSEFTNLKFGSYRYEMKTPAGEKYFHVFETYKEKDDFEDMILAKFSRLSVSNGISFYILGIPIILGVSIGILILDFVVLLWFVAFYDLLKSEFKDNHNKWIWYLSFLILPIIAPLYYLMISTRQKRA